MSLMKKLAGETALYGLSSIVGRFLNYLLVPLYTRSLGTGEYGVVSEFYAYTGFLMVVLSYRMESAFFRFGTEKTDREAVFSTAMQSLLASTIGFAALVFLFSNPISAALGYENHVEYVRWFGLILAFDALCEIPFARLRVEQRPRRFVFLKLFNIGLTIALNLFFLVGCPFILKQNASGFLHDFVSKIFDPDLRVGYIFLSNLLASGATFCLLLPQIGRFGAKFDLVLWKKMLNYAGPLVIVGFAGIINEMLDRALLKHLLPGSQAENLAQLGIYAANYKLAMLITLFTQAYRYAAEPFFFRQKSDPNAPQILADACRWFTLAGCAAVLAVLLYLDLLKGFIGSKFHSGLFIVPILLAANLFLGIYYNVSVWYRLTDKVRLGAWISIGGALITLVLNVWWAPIFGYAAAAWATLICYFFMVAATWHFGKEYYPVPYPIKRISLYIVSCFFVYFLSQFWRPFFHESRALILTANSFLMVAWLGGVWFFEKENLKALFVKPSSN